MAPVKILTANTTINTTTTTLDHLIAHLPAKLRKAIKKKQLAQAKKQLAEVKFLTKLQKNLPLKRKIRKILYTYYIMHTRLIFETVQPERKAFKAKPAPIRVLRIETAEPFPNWMFASGALDELEKLLKEIKLEGFVVQIWKPGHTEMVKPLFEACHD